MNITFTLLKLNYWFGVLRILYLHVVILFTSVLPQIETLSDWHYTDYSNSFSHFTSSFIFLNFTQYGVREYRLSI